MNKKLFLGMFATAGMLLATSCSNDELDVVQSGNEAQVTFSLAAEGGIATRAISDGTGADLLYYAIFDADGKLITTIAGSTNGLLTKPKAFPNGSKQDAVEVTLAKGQEYTAVFWAQDASCNAYTVTAEPDGLKVAVDYEGDNNDETRDAFFKAETFKVTGNTEIDVVLKRPFAQINVGVTEADWKAAVESGIEITASKVVIKNAATSINLLDGTVKGEQAVEYDFAAIPTDPAILEVDVDRDGTIQENEKYKYLSMSYILTDNDEKRTTLEADGLQFTFKSGGEDIVFDEGLHAVPVQRNWRTNILGTILTGEIQFNISIDQEFEDDHFVNVLGTPVTVSSRKELDELLKNPVVGTIKLDQALEYTPSGYNADDDNGIDFFSSDVTVEGAPTNITSGDSEANKSNGDYGLIAKLGTKVTYNNINLTSYGGGVAAADGSAVTFNSGSVYVDSPSTSGRYIFYAVGEGSTITINGGKFSWDPADNQKRAYIYAGAGTTVYVNGGIFGKASIRSGYTAGILGDGTVIIKGGTFGFDPTKWMASGYKAIKKGDNYVVVPEIVASLSNVTASSTVELNSDITVSTGTTIHTENASADITINGNGNSIISTAESADDFTWEGGTIPAMSTILSSTNGSKVTVNNLTFGGTMSALMLGHYQDTNYNNYNTELNYVNVIDAKVVSFSANVSPAVCVYGKATLNNCQITGTTLSELDTDPMWPVYDLVCVNYSTTTINGGKIGSIYTWNQAALIVENSAEVEKIVVRGNMNTTKPEWNITIKTGTTVGTIDLSAITNNQRVNITIESGATIGKIVANGVNYDSIEDFKNAQ